MAETQAVPIIQYDVNHPPTTGDQTVIKTISFTTKFTAPPKILVSYFQIDYPGQSLNFNMQVTSVQLTTAQITFQKYGSTIMNGLYVNIFAVQDSDIQVQVINLSYSNGAMQTIQFIQPPVNSKQRKALCFPIGYNYTDSGNAQRGYTINVLNISQTQYTINIITTEIHNLLSIYVNCLEFFVESIGAYSMISDSQDLDFVDMTTTSIANPYVLSFNISPNLQGTPLAQIGYTGAVNNHNINIRLSIGRKSYLNNQEQIQAFVWGNSQSYSTKGGYFQYMMYNCQLNNSTINFPQNKTCVSSCPDGSYQTTFGAGSICTSCILNCNQCPDDTTCIQCAPRYDLVNQKCVPTSCTPSQYILNQQCYDNIPGNTYCDVNKVCQQCSIQCKSCDSTFSTCLSCLPSQYLYNGVCSYIKPNNTYCQYKLL